MKKWISAAVLVVSIVCYTGIAFAGVTSISGWSSKPIRITNSGSYLLQSNITINNANTTAILVTADNVTIDLNGFAIIGPNVCTAYPVICNNSGTGIGIDASGKQNIKIYNGTVRGMGDKGILTGGGAIIESVRVVSNGNGGIQVNGSSTVSGNTVTNNYGTGIYVNGSSTVSGNTVNGNGHTGIYVSSGGTVSGNTVIGNGTVGINIFGSSTVSGNSVNDNIQSGIILVYGTVSGNAVAGNGGNGLALSLSAGYFNNVLKNNTGGDVNAGVNLGHNLCSGVPCP